MRFLLLATLAFTLALTGCSTLDGRDRRLLRSYGVSQSVYAKMMHHEPLALNDIIELSHRGVPGPFIVHYLRPTYAVYKLSPEDMTRLRQGGVDDGVIRYLAATVTLFSPDRAPLYYQDDPLFSGSHRDRDYWRY